MRVMGIPEGYRLVMPRTLAMAIAMPLVAVWTTMAALLGGMLASDLCHGTHPGDFFTALPKTVEISNLWLSLVKSCVFGVSIACWPVSHGLRVKPDTQSLGEGTTASVVSSITMVISGGRAVCGDFQIGGPMSDHRTRHVVRRHREKTLVRCSRRRRVYGHSPGPGSHCCPR